MIGIQVAELIMLARIYALYYQDESRPGFLGPFVIGCLLTIWCIQTGVNTWLLTYGQPVIHNSSSGVHACTGIFNPKLAPAASSSSSWIPLIYDTIVIGITIYELAVGHRKEKATQDPEEEGTRDPSYRPDVARRLLEDALLYYAVIFAVTLTLTVMIAAAPTGIRNIAAQAELLLTVAMMSRITLSLREIADEVKAKQQGETCPSQ